MEKNKISIIIVEDDEDFIFLIRQMIDGDSGINILGHAVDKESAIHLAVQTKPDIVLMDLNLSNTGLDGIPASREIRFQTDAKIIILSSFEDEQTIMKASVECFASNYIFKSNFSSIVNTIKETAFGRTASEMFIYNHILSKLTDAEKAIFHSMLGEDITLRSSPKTIANQKTRVFKKLGVKNQKELQHIFGK